MTTEADATTSTAAPADGTTTTASPIDPAKAAEARARLDTLTNDSAWTDRLFSGDAEATREFRELTELAASEDTVAAAMSGDAAPMMFETTVGGEMPRRAVAETVAAFRDAGISDGAIAQAMKGEPVTAAEYAAVKAFQAARHGSKEWRDRFLSGDHTARREQLLIDIVMTHGAK